MKLSDRLALVEQKTASGELEGRDLEVIRLQLARAEAKLLALQPVPLKRAA